MKAVFFILFLAITYNSLALQVSYNFESDACWLHSYERTAKSSNSCPSGYSFDSDDKLCLQNCPSGFTPDGEYCKTKYYHSKSGYATSSECKQDQGVQCQQRRATGRYFPVCVGHYLDYADACYRDVAQKKTGITSQTSCYGDFEMINGLCYEKCPEGYKANGSTCVNQCPYGYSQCGNICLAGKTCNRAISDLNMKDFELATVGPSMNKVLGAMGESSLTFDHPICA